MEKITPITPETNPQDRELTRAEKQELGRKFLAARAAEAPRQVKHYVDDMISLEHDFAKQLKRSQDRGEKHLSKKEFEAWEDEFRGDWDHHLAELRHVEDPRSGFVVAADFEEPMMRSHEEVDDTIEVQAGHFFEERADQLRAAIRASDRPSAAEDLQALTAFVQTVYEHADLRYLTPEEIRDRYEGDEYDKRRTQVHNAVINQFNHLNDLADQYGVRRFTPRNFWTSEGPQPTWAVKSRMKHDRHQVERYCVVALSAEDERASTLDTSVELMKASQGAESNLDKLSQAERDRRVLKHFRDLAKGA